ncbi:uncharacterized protein FMAN_07345 [Fusarium mangiferae]|uniref:Uncharacterized protein n=1 Tax=Fusarium mangiferae TaxID=192010 RepID=A0A1L7T3F9_FUSMA|nr:uncharacterized protein FMAN_07345 [Fusarium mangiferae]CVK92449.1 uncharacterized protein FMAN_07345 [Fusarium mangiferae]
MEALRTVARSAFQSGVFHNSPLHYNIVTTTDTNPHSPVTLVEASASLAEVEDINKSDRSLLLVKIVYDATLSCHAFRTTQSDIQRLFEIFHSDPYGLGLVANDMTGFHCLTGSESGPLTSYYLQCAAYKILWTYNSESQFVRGITFVISSKRGSSAFADLVNIMKLNLALLLHPLFLPLSAATQTVAFFDKLLRQGYDQARLVEVATGYRPITELLETREGLRKLTDVSRETSILIRKSLMVIRRIKQWKLAARDFERLALNHRPASDSVRLGLLSAEASAKTVSASLKLIQSRLEVMEIDFNYIVGRAENQSTVVYALTSINLAMAATRDSSSMKVIAIMTMAFLPGTFLAALFAVPSLDWDSQTVIQSNFWIYWAFAIPFTIMVFIIWMFLTQRQELSQFYDRIRVYTGRKGRKALST